MNPNGGNRFGGMETTSVSDYNVGDRSLKRQYPANICAPTEQA